MKPQEHVDELEQPVRELFDSLLPRRQARAATAAWRCLEQMEDRDPQSLSQEEIAAISQATATLEAAEAIYKLRESGQLPDNKHRVGVIFELECRWQEGDLLHRRGTPSPKVEEEMVEKLKVLRHIINRVINGSPIKPRFFPVWLWKLVR